MLEWDGKISNTIRCTFHDWRRRAGGDGVTALPLWTVGKWSRCPAKLCPLSPSLPLFDHQARAIHKKQDPFISLLPPSHLYLPPLPLQMTTIHPRYLSLSHAFSLSFSILHHILTPPIMRAIEYGIVSLKSPSQVLKSTLLTFDCHVWIAVF